MTKVKEVSRRELSSLEIIDIVEDGGRVVIEVSVLGKSIKVVIRRHDGTYYCDTPMKLLRYDNQKEFQDCLERFRLTKPVTEEETDVVGTSA